MAAATERPVAFITGGTTGIGLATARLLYQMGFAVVVTGANPETLAAAQRSLPGEVVILKVDARILSDTAHAADELKQRSAASTLHFSTPALAYAADRGGR